MIRICDKCLQEKEHYARGLCQPCYANMRRAARLDHTWEPYWERRGPRPLVSRKCSLCGGKYYARGLCQNCYTRARNREIKGLGFVAMKERPGTFLITHCNGTMMKMLFALLALPQDVEGRRITQLSRELAPKFNISRQRVHQILLKMQRYGWLQFQLKITLPPDLEQYVREHSPGGEHDGKVRVE
jgi:hypothetical protein